VKIDFFQGPRSARSVSFDQPSEPANQMSYAYQLLPNCRITAREPQRLFPGAFGLFNPVAVLEGTAQLQSVNGWWGR
jgi:hypothetical protein